MDKQNEPQTSPDTGILNNSPLVLVLSQVRLPGSVSKLSMPSNIELDQAMDSAGFPMVVEQQDATLSISPSENTLQLEQNGNVHAYANADMTLHAIVAGSFISLYCTNYSDKFTYKGHQSFIETLCGITDAVCSIIGPFPVSRIGYRYVDQLETQDISTLLQPACLGFTGIITPASVPKIAGSTVDTIFSFSDADTSSTPAEGLRVRSGMVPAGSTVDPSIQQCPKDVWAVDVDAYSLRPTVLDRQEIAETATELSMRAHDFFFSNIATSEFTKKFK